MLKGKYEKGTIGHGLEMHIVRVDAGKPFAVCNTNTSMVRAHGELEIEQVTCGKCHSWVVKTVANAMK